MADIYNNKIVANGEVLIDLTADTVAPDTLLKGATAHDKSGAPITGTCDYDSNTQDATANAAEILTGKTAYVSGAKVTGTMPNRGGQASEITTKAQEVTIQNGYHDGSGKVKIAAAEQAKIVAGNILNGITILGVEGTLRPSSDVKIEPVKSVSPSFTEQQITPAEGYEAMAQVNIAAIAVTKTQNSAGGYTVTIG